MSSTPNYARRRLGLELRRMRTEAGKPLEEVALDCGWDKSKVSRIENAKISMTRHDLYQFVHAYGVDGEHLARLENWLSDSRGVAWWREFADVINSQYEELIALESQAFRVTTANFCVIPGLLQARDYARATLTSSAFVPDPDNADALVQVREKRQRTLHGDNALEFTAAIGAAVLHVETGGKKVLRKQLHHLLELSELPNVAIRVVPFTTDAGIYLGGTSILDFPDPHDPSVVHVEYQNGSEFKESDRDVRRYRRSLQHVLNCALTVEESRKTIASRWGEL